MTTVYYGIAKGKSELNGPATMSTTGTTSQDVEITANLANITVRQDLIVALENLKNYILKSTWPPA